MTVSWMTPLNMTGHSFLNFLASTTQWMSSVGLTLEWATRSALQWVQPFGFHLVDRCSLHSVYSVSKNMSVSEAQQCTKGEDRIIGSSFAFREVRKIRCHPTETSSGFRNGACDKQRSLGDVFAETVQDTMMVVQTFKTKLIWAESDARLVKALKTHLLSLPESHLLSSYISAYGRVINICYILSSVQLLFLLLTSSWSTLAYLWCLIFFKDMSKNAK